CSSTVRSCVTHSFPTRRSSDLTQQAQLVIGIQDLEALRQAGLAPVAAQESVGKAMEGAYPHAAGGDPQQLLDAAAHLRRRLVGEDRKSTRLNSSHVKISYAVFC